MHKGRRAIRLRGERKLKGKRMNLLTEGEERESCASFDNGGQSSLVGSFRVAKHGDEMEERESRIRVSRDKGSPRDDIGRWDLPENFKCVGKSVEFGVKSDEFVVQWERKLVVCCFDNVGVNCARVFGI